MKIKLLEKIGENCHSLDDGDALYQLLFPEIEKGNPVELDFSGVKSVITPFLNAGFGKLVDRFGKETVMERVRLGPISDDHLQRINRFIDRVDRETGESLSREMMEDLFAEDELSETGE